MVTSKGFAGWVVMGWMVVASACSAGSSSGSGAAAQVGPVDAPADGGMSAGADGGNATSVPAPSATASSSSTSGGLSSSFNTSGGLPTSTHGGGTSSSSSTGGAGTSSPSVASSSSSSTSSAASASSSTGASPETCDGTDNDRDGATDEGLTPPDTCLHAGVCEGTLPVCAGSRGWMCQYNVAGWQAQELACDGLDNDCDGAVDEALVPPAMCKSAGVCSGTVAQCGGAAGWTCTYAHAAYAEEENRCDGLDNDCDGLTDECTGGAQCHATVQVCTDPLDIDFDRDGVTARAGDCSAMDAQVAPGRMDVVDGRDNDCDGFVDEGTDMDGAALGALREYRPATLSPSGEWDYFPRAYTPGEWHVRVVAAAGATVNLVVGLFDSAGAALGAPVNVSGAGGFEVMSFTVSAAGTYHVGVSGSSTGAYRLALFPGLYDPNSIAGGDAPTPVTSVPAGTMVIAALNEDTNPFGQVVRGDELMLLTTAGAVSPLTLFQVPSIRLQDPAISPSRRRIAFVANGTGVRLDVYTLDLVAKRVRRVSPDIINCPQGASLAGFARPAFTNDDEVVFIGECSSALGELDVVVRARADGSVPPVVATLGAPPMLCLSPYVHPRTYTQGGVEKMAISAVGCALSATNSTEGGRVASYALNGVYQSVLPAHYPGAGSTRMTHTHDKLFAFDIRPDGTRYAVSTREGVLEFDAATGARLSTRAVNHSNAGDYWNQEMLDYEDGGSRLAISTAAGVDAQNGDSFDVWVWTGATATPVARGMAIRRGVAW